MCGNANAIPLRLDAISTEISISDFYIDFADNGDSIFQFNELTAFSGITLSGLPMAVGDVTFATLTSSPQIAGISDSNVNPAFANWNFTDPDMAIGINVGVPSILFQYDISNQVAVPEPSTYYLLGLGLLGLTYVRRRKTL